MSDRLATEQSEDILFVDLDGSLIRTDLLYESLFQLMKSEPRAIVLMPLWAARGRAQLKAQVAGRVSPEVEKLPYNDQLLELIQAKKAEGVRVVLATASAKGWAEAVASHLGHFDDVLATSGDRNLKGRSKLAAIKSYCEQNGYRRFSYVGDANADLPIWKEAKSVYVVNPSKGLSRRLDRFQQPVARIGDPQNRLAALVKALRPRQWVKNILIFVPLLTSMQILNPAKVILALYAFAAFCCCSSAIYIVNDLSDLAADRAHADKRRRPFAAGRLPLAWGPPLAVGLIALALTIAWFTLPTSVLAVLIVYSITTLSYSLVIKSRLMADVLVLAVLYSLRVMTGHLATGIPNSEWLMTFSLFLFLSLALVKRYVELDTTKFSDPNAKIQGRGYQPSDIGLIETFGACSGYISVLVLALYIKSNEVRLVYHHPEVLWLICLILIYWISRIWFLAKRRHLSSDPVVFAIEDRHSLLLGALTVVIVLLGAVAPKWGTAPSEGGPAPATSAPAVNDRAEGAGPVRPTVAAGLVTTP